MPVNQIKRALCVGNAAIDRTFAVIGEPRLATSNPAVAGSSFGGVARNVAENLARLGIAVGLITCVGNDDGGRALLRNCAASGIDVSESIMSRDDRTAQYVAIIDSHGELVLGAGDAGIIETMEITELPEAEWTFVDASLSASLIARLIEAARVNGFRLAVDAVSTEKAQRLPPNLSGVSIVFLNVDEARAYLSAPPSDTPDELATHVRARGAEFVVLTDGARGCLIATDAGLTRVEAQAITPVDVTGAGDALIAGTLFGLLSDETLERSVRAGARAAAVTISTPA